MSAVETQPVQSTANPWRLAARNSLAALVPIAFGGFAYVRRYDAFNGTTAWWAWFAVAGFIIGVCFGCAALGQIIGTRRADVVFKVVAAATLVAMIIWLRLTLDGRGR